MLHTSYIIRKEISCILMFCFVFYISYLDCFCFIFIVFIYSISLLTPSTTADSTQFYQTRSPYLYGEKASLGNAFKRHHQDKRERRVLYILTLTFRFLIFFFFFLIFWGQQSGLYFKPMST